MLTEEQKEEVHKIMNLQSEVNNTIVGFYLNDVGDDLKAKYLEYMAERDTLLYVKIFVKLLLLTGNGDVINEKIKELVNKSVEKANEEFTSLNKYKDQFEELQRMMNILFNFEKEDEI